MSRFLYGLFLVGLVLYFTTSVAQAQVEIVGPTETPVKVPGINVPNETFGDRTIYPGNEQVQIGARVGDFVVNVSGLSSPNASVVLNDTSGTFLRSTVADNKGYFYISQLNVRKGVSGFCFTTVDFKRIGDTQACVEFEPIQASKDIDNVFLPPTLGLFRTEINAGQQALIYGYSMPGAEVTIKTDKDSEFTVTADETGYYEYKYEKVPAGTYNLASTAVLNQTKSLEPKTQKTLVALTVPEQVENTISKVTSEGGRILTTTIWGFILVIFFLLFIIALLLLLLNPRLRHLMIDTFREKIRKPLHHDWYLSFLDKNLK